MALYKQQLCARMKRPRLSLEEKIKILNYSNENLKRSYREIAAQFQTGKTAAPSIFQDGKKLRKEFKFFKDNCKTKRAGQFSLINETRYKWYGKFCAAGIYPFGSMLQEEALKKKERKMKNRVWYSRNANDVSIPTVKSWIERIPKLVRGYELEDIRNMDELGLFFKLLLDKGLIEKAKSKKCGKKAKVRLAVAFFVNDDGQKVDEPVIIWKSKKPGCFKNLKGCDLTRSLGVHYFANNKAWINSEIMSYMLRRLDRKMKMQNRNVALFLDNGTSHQKSIEKNLSNIKLVFLLKNTT